MPTATSPCSHREATDATDDFEMLCAADHPTQPVEWLWNDRIPIGKVTLLVGDPGLGKSLLALDVAPLTPDREAFSFIKSSRRDG